jgi:cell division protein FtsL
MPEFSSSFDAGSRGFGAGLLDGARDEVAADYRLAREAQERDTVSAFFFLRRATRVMITLLLAAVIASAAGVIYLRHQHRLAYLSLHAAEAERDRLNIEWGQLLLERATYSGQPIVEEQARRRLTMAAPAPADTIILRIPAEAHGRGH